MLMLRRTVQGLVMIALLLIVVGVFGAREDTVRWLVRFSPLMGISGRVATRGWVGSFAPAVLFLLIETIRPRFFCHWVCPLGTASDILDWVWGKRAVSAPAPSRSSFPVLLLIVTVGVSFTSLEIAGWFDPLGMCVRLVSPTVVSNRDALYCLFQWQQGMSIWAQDTIFHQMRMAALVMWALALGLTIRGRRAWCHMVCPLGCLYRFVGECGRKKGEPEP